MIHSTLSESQRIESLHPKFKLVFDYIKQHDLLHAEKGRIELEGNEVFINNVEPTMKTVAEQVIEVHREYIDIHFPLTQTETVGYKSLESMTQAVAPFDAEGDCQLFSDVPSSFLTVQPGEFWIAYPEDGHAPNIGTGSYRKLIAKIKL